jgi:hypothetical protein
MKIYNFLQKKEYYELEKEKKSHLDLFCGRFGDYAGWTGHSRNALDRDDYAYRNYDFFA